MSFLIWQFLRGLGQGATNKMFVEAIESFQARQVSEMDWGYVGSPLLGGYLMRL
jgi:hypothetical protein